MAVITRRRRDFWSGRKVLITGNTGFKGSWLSLILLELGADVVGLSKANFPSQSLYGFLTDRNQTDTVFGDILDLDFVTRVVKSFKPEIVFHMAAQPIVSQGYTDPIGTFSTNIIGTANLLSACGESDAVDLFLNVTSDKCYDNNESGMKFTESSPLGGIDPYSASKACAEIAGKSLGLALIENGVLGKYVSGRAGNVFGGGDFGVDRLIPDVVRSIAYGNPLQVRSPNSIRPWQFVMNALDGYLAAVEMHVLNSDYPVLEHYNFGPDETDCRSVTHILDLFKAKYGEKLSLKLGESQFNEALSLNLDISKAKTLLHWAPRVNLVNALDRTVEWYNAWINQDLGLLDHLTMAEVRAFVND